MPQTPEDRKRWFIRDLLALYEEHDLGLTVEHGGLVIVPNDVSARDLAKNVQWRA